MTAYPTSVDPDDHDFSFVRGGRRVPAEFDLDGDRADLFLGRDRYRRKHPGE